MKRRNVLLGTFLILCVAGAGFAGWNIYRELKPRIAAEQVYDQIRDMAFEEKADGQSEVDLEESVRSKPDFEALLAWNPDIVGWIWLPGTDIDYPVVQGQDNDYYLNHTTDHTRSVIGSIFMESKNSKDFQDDVTALYGHHIRGGRMFSSLSGYKEQAYYNEHPVIYLYTPDQDYVIELFAGEILNGATATLPLIFESMDARDTWLKALQKSSRFQSPVEIGEDDRFVALCTCSYEYNNARYAVYGVLRPQ